MNKFDWIVVGRNYDCYPENTYYFYNEDIIYEVVGFEVYHTIFAIMCRMLHTKHSYNNIPNCPLFIDFKTRNFQSTMSLEKAKQCYGIA